MFGDLTEQPQQIKRTVLLGFERFRKKPDNASNDLELRRRRSHASTSQPQGELAVCVRNAYKRYGLPTNPVVVLDGLDMTVPKGVIYSLLGASGCGKTTLLSCILGRRRLNSGQVWVLGGAPGSKASGIPGVRVGYMPQENAIYNDFTIRETLIYYGWVLGMSSGEIEERFQFLQSLLMLPHSEQLVKTLSGGQQRRLSLAAALLHEPELLILDEPTVGVDPVLRETIWEHLLNISRGGNVTIVITTHYIEEARQAHIVGLLRGGHFLAEEPPEHLISRYGAETLEEVFLKLSVAQNMDQDNTVAVVTDKTAENSKEITKEEASCSTSTADDDKIVDSLPEAPVQKEHVPQVSEPRFVIKGHRLKALVWKGFVWMWRNIPAMLCVIMLPVTQLPIFCYCIGNDPVDIPVAVVNYETNNYVYCDKVLSCNSNQLSCSYLGYLEKRGLTLMYYNSEREAVESVLKGETYASLVVRHNYSAAMRIRVADWEGMETWDMVASEIDVFRDFSNKHIANQLKVYLYDTFQTFLQDYLVCCGKNKKLLTLPVKFETPVYGTQYPNFTDFALPGILVILTFFLAVATTAFGMLIERHEGGFARTFVIGITEIELLLAHIICQFLIVTLQMVMSLVCVFYFFEMTQRGSLLLIVILILFTGFSGMCYGLLISCVCDNITTAMYLALGSVLPMLFLCGIVWPVEAVHPLLLPIANIIPITKATESLRSILQRGWGLSMETVYMGFLSITVWTAIFLIVSVLFLKFKKS